MNYFVTLDTYKLVLNYYSYKLNYNLNVLRRFVMEMVLAGVVSASAMIFLLLKLDLKKVCGYDFFVDIGFTFLLAWMFAGTYSGMMAAIIGGAIVSIFLFFVKKINGYKKLTFHNGKITWRQYNV